MSSPSPSVESYKVICIFSIYTWPANSFPLDFDEIKQNGIQVIEYDQDSNIMDNILKYGKKTNIFFTHDDNCSLNSLDPKKNTSCKVGDLLQNIPDSQLTILQNNGISKDDLIGYFKANIASNGKLSYYGSCIREPENNNIFTYNYIWVSPTSNMAFFVNTAWMSGISSGKNANPLLNCDQQDLCLPITGWSRDNNFLISCAKDKRCCAGGFLCDKNQFCNSYDESCTTPTPPTPPSNRKTDCIFSMQSDTNNTCPSGKECIPNDVNCGKSVIGTNKTCPGHCVGVTPPPNNNNNNNNNNNKKLTGGQIAGIVIGVIAFLAIIIGILVKFYKK